MADANNGGGQLYDELMAFDSFLPPTADEATRSKVEQSATPGDNNDTDDVDQLAVFSDTTEDRRPETKRQLGIIKKKKMDEVKSQVCKVFQSSVSLILLLIVYSFIGAAVLNFTETFQEETNFKELDKIRGQIVRDIIDVTTTSSNNSNVTLTSVVEQLLVDYGLAKESLRPYTGSPGWTYWGALFFCGTIYTTVGYGSVYPLTTTGRIVTIVYALVGIPLCLVVLMNLGKSFTHGVKFFWSFVRRFYYTGSCRRVRRMIPAGRMRMTVTQRIRHRMTTGRCRDDDDNDDCVPYDIDDKFNLPPVVAIIIAFLYMVLGSLIYPLWETDWSFLDAFYFIFISLSTIGLGDVVPQHPKFFMATSLYIFVGLALVAMVINVCMEVLDVSLSKAADKVLTSAGKIGNHDEEENV